MESFDGGISNQTVTSLRSVNVVSFQVHDGKNLKGRSNDAIASACLYIACRQEGVPRTFKVGEVSLSILIP